MLTKTDILFAISFAALLIAELICGSVDYLNNWHFITKPSLLISLLFYFYTQSKGLEQNTRIPILLALVLSLSGDILLMFDNLSPHFFMFGLLSFLLAHICYSVVFFRCRDIKTNPLRIIGILSIYAAVLFYILKDGLGDLLIPVIVYIIIILVMVITAYLRRGKISQKSYILVFVGALLFTISDSILAINKFYQPLEYASISIMLSYGLAQYLITLGLLKQR